MGTERYEGSMGGRGGMAAGINISRNSERDSERYSKG